MPAPLVPTDSGLSGGVVTGILGAVVITGGADHLPTLLLVASLVAPFRLPFALGGVAGLAAGNQLCVLLFVHLGLWRLRGLAALIAAVALVRRWQAVVRRALLRLALAVRCALGCEYCGSLDLAVAAYCEDHTPEPEIMN